ncbi:F0F1 ATP synthase subunit B [Opitutus sp. ER46]|uniref:F0F1 ATP synthase subunit B n=1 Tax=Opitutus sp. ER46 TaxID=2161864 RepID=UPI000D2FB085|nr:F0F1 ATP synthase subunit B [Opitutus sp. ER46]PTX98622.1 ATP synthase F0 subunit B [Opitutus sp. ER46]
MTLPLFLAAAVEAHATEPGIVEKFGLDWKYVAIQAFSFLIVLAVLYKFGIKPTTATMEERNRKIEAGLKHAEEMQAKLAAAQQESAAIVKQAQVEASKIVDDARKTAKEFLDRQMQDATARAADSMAKAQQAIELEHKKMLADARTEIARLVVVTTERVLAKKLTDADRSAYNDAATRELTTL